MTSDRISVDRQRERITTAELIAFDALTNSELEWLANEASDPKRKAYAGWELAFREAHGIDVTLDDGSPG